MRNPAPVIFAFLLGLFLGIFIGGNNPYRQTITTTKEVSIIKEKADCEKQGGEFNIFQGMHHDDQGYLEYGASLDCTLPSKTLTHIEI